MEPYWSQFNGDSALSLPEIREADCPSSFDNPQRWRGSQAIRNSSESARALLTGGRGRGAGTCGLRECPLEIFSKKFPQTMKGGSEVERAR